MTYQPRASFQRPASADEIERLVYHMPTVAELAENDWSRGFALSIRKNSRRHNWRPSDKQLAMMRKLVSELFTHIRNNDQEDDFSLIE
jgi:hypothetical protein